MPRRIELEQFGSFKPEESDASNAAAETPNVEQDFNDPALAPKIERDPILDQAACLAKISNTLTIVAAEQAGLRARCIGDAITALSLAAETLLPRLARAGFAALVTEATQTIARRGQWPELVLSVAPINIEPITGALGECKSATEIRIVADSALGPGDVQFAWSQGGAEMEIEAITLAALDFFRLQLESHAQQGAI